MQDTFFSTYWEGAQHKAEMRSRRDERCDTLHGSSEIYVQGMEDCAGGAQGGEIRLANGITAGQDLAFTSSHFGHGQRN